MYIKVDVVVDNLKREIDSHSGKPLLSAEGIKFPNTLLAWDHLTLAVPLFGKTIHRGNSRPRLVLKFVQRRI